MDVLQRDGHYTPPSQAPATLGLEFSGTVEGLGPDAGTEFSIGDQVFGLAYGGAYTVLEHTHFAKLTILRCLRRVHCRLHRDANSQTSGAVMGGSSRDPRGKLTGRVGRHHAVRC